MNKDEFNDLYNSLGFDDKTLATELDVDPSTVWRWRVGDTHAPDMLRKLLNMMIESKKNGQHTTPRTSDN